MLGTRDFFFSAIVHLLPRTICHLVHQWEGNDTGLPLTIYYLCGESGAKQSCCHHSVCNTGTICFGHSSVRYLNTVFTYCCLVDRPYGCTVRNNSLLKTNITLLHLKLKQTIMWCFYVVPIH